MKRNPGKRVLVTGAGGLVGTHLLYELLKKGYRTRALVRCGSRVEQIRHVFSFYSGDSEKMLSSVDWYTGDLTDEEVLRGALDGIRQVYHCAALVSFDPRDRKALFALNVGGTATLVDLSHELGVEKFCFVSSIGALGHKTGSEPVTENDVFKDSGEVAPYSLSKFLAEMEVWRGVEEGLNAVIVNPSVILGPGNWKKVGQKIYHRLYKGQPFYTEGINGFVDVRDVVSAMILLMESNISGERFILNAENISYKDLFSRIAGEFDTVPPSFRIPGFLLEIYWRIEHLRSILFRTNPLLTKPLARAAVKECRYSSEKLIRATGFRFRPVEESVKEICRIFLDEVNAGKSSKIKVKR